MAFGVFRILMLKFVVHGRTNQPCTGNRQITSVRNERKLQNATCARVPNIVFSRVPLNIMVICIRVTLKSSGYQPMSELLMRLPYEGARYV